MASGAAAVERPPSATRARPRVSRRNVLIAIGTLTLGLQLASARWLVASFETPNAGREIARRLAAGGRYEAPYGGRLWGPSAGGRELPRAYLLPAEPLFLAALFRSAPPSSWRYAHVPVTTLLVVAVAAVAMRIGGVWLGAATGAWASIQPFVVVHGPVWDDAFLAAALVWLALAVLCRQLCADRGMRWRGLDVALALGLFVTAGIAALARLEAQIVLLGAALATLIAPSLRSVRREGAAIALGVVVALCAWGWRNQSALGAFFVGSTRDGIALWESNGPHARASLRQGQVMMLSLDPSRMRAHWDSTSRMSEVEANAYFRRAAIRHVLAHPLDVSRTVALKVLVSLGGVRPEMSLRAPRNAVALVANAAVLALVVAGLPVLRAAFRNASELRGVPVLLAIVAFTGLLMLAAGPVGLRYRIMLDGVLWIAGGAGLLRLSRRTPWASMTKAVT